MICGFMACDRTTAIVSEEEKRIKSPCFSFDESVTEPSASRDIEGKKAGRGL